MIHEQDYPRPQLVRPDWQNLNGAWRFAFDDDNLGEAQGWYDGALPGSQTIRVPFTYETEASGIADQTVHCCVWYQRQFTLTEAEAEADQLLWLHFEGSDYTTQVWVNGQLAGSHRGGYSRFSFEIANLVQAGDNRLTVKVSDSLSRSQPRGKQRWIKDSFACWYVQTTGLWKTVWLEPTARQAIAGCKLTPDLSRGLVHAEVSLTGLPELGDESTGDLYLDTAVFFNETLVCRHSLAVSGSQLSLDLPLTSTAASVWGIQTWTPQNPALYDITFTLRSQAGVIDQAASYFGMREISIADGQVLLNGSPLYQRLILDQGYWENSGLTPPDEAALITDIERIQQLGYNGVRKHQKVEDERFLYWCDVKGLLVWSEFPAAYQFNDEAVDNTISEWMAIVRQNYNHPCIITWTPFNESWGIPEIRSSRPQQHFTEAVYHLTKAFDPMRPVIVNDGWIHTVSDIITLHDYEAEGQ
ncbi:MAG: glycoside hydrolase family 2 TIM barrel-domain containing protein, partial [Oscillospiraceae bacterium]|nr:glycoside hydrolase family 2 TIM barrel-domain containing protein [Oscillospiraceae bacterium]